MSGKLRVIGGTARGRKLNLVPGDITRPITDRVKENLFNILGSDIAGCDLLDLFSGTGAIGIEALSRGAKFVRMNDKNQPAIQTITDNIEPIKFDANTYEIVRNDAFVLLRRNPDRAFDYVYVAPPQYYKMWEKAMELLDQNPNWLVDDGWIVVQIDPIEYVEMKFEHFEEFDRRKYGKTELVFYERKEEN